MSKRLLTIAVLAVIAISFTACSGNAVDEGTHDWLSESELEARVEAYEEGEREASPYVYSDEEMEAVIKDYQNREIEAHSLNASEVYAGTNGNLSQATTKIIKIVAQREEKGNCVDHRRENPPEGTTPCHCVDKDPENCQREHKSYCERGCKSELCKCCDS